MVQQVKVYSTPTCPWCKRTKQFLDENKVTCQNLDVASNKAAGNETGVPGLFAAGDVTNVPEKQIVVAAGEGAKAALQAYRYLQRLSE